MLFSYKFFTFSQLFSQHPNKFQNHSQISIHGTNHSQIPTPHTTETPMKTHGSKLRQPQPPKHHHYTTTTTTKIKITERDRWFEGEIARRRDQRRDRAARCVVRSARSGASDRRTGARGSPTTSTAWFGLPLLPLARALSLSLSLCVSDPEIVWSENLSFKPFPWSKPHFSKSTSNNFRKIYFSCATKHSHFRKSISGSDLKPKQTQPKKYQLVELQDFWQKRKIYYFRFSIIFKYLVVLNLIFLRRDNTSCVLPIYVIQTLTIKFHK